MKSWTSSFINRTLLITRRPHYGFQLFTAAVTQGWTTLLELTIVNSKMWKLCCCDNDSTRNAIALFFVGRIFCKMIFRELFSLPLLSWSFVVHRVWVRAHVFCFSFDIVTGTDPGVRSILRNTPPLSGHCVNMGSRTRFGKLAINEPRRGKLLSKQPCWTGSLSAYHVYLRLAEKLDQDQMLVVVLVNFDHGLLNFLCILRLNKVCFRT